MAQLSARNHAVTEYWMAFYIDHDLAGRCRLCNNHGMLRNHLGNMEYCICPNGQARREHDPAHQEPPAPDDVLTPKSRRWHNFVIALGNMLAKEACDHTLQKTTTVLTYMAGINADKTLRYFQERGGHCDCEVLLNVNKE